MPKHPTPFRQTFRAFIGSYAGEVIAGVIVRLSELVGLHPETIAGWLVLSLPVWGAIPPNLYWLLGAASLVLLPMLVGPLRWSVAWSRRSSQNKSEAEIERSGAQVPSPNAVGEPFLGIAIGLKRRTVEKELSEAGEDFQIAIDIKVSAKAKGMS
jgi:hypothetical protein